MRSGTGSDAQTGIMAAIDTILMSGAPVPLRQKKPPALWPAVAPPAGGGGSELRPVTGA